jgi:hypothetical protein
MSRATVTALHHEAMELADKASVELLRGNVDRALQLTRQAFEKERDAATHVAADMDFEPTRSVLHRSAASLALECGETREAERLIAVALSGKSPNEIAEELRDLLEQVHFQRHLDLRGIVLAPEEFQISITGSAVGLGVAQSDVILSRLQDIEKLVYRTAERKRGGEFRERGKPKDELMQNVQLFLSVPRAASFAVSVKIGHSAQLTFEGGSFPEAVINELFDCLDLFSLRKFEQLRTRVSDQPYLTNFLALAKRIGPDGKRVNMVGFTAQRGKQQRRITLTHPQFEISLPDVEQPSSPSEAMRLTGNLKFADSLRSNRDEIRILDDNGKQHRILVPPGMMDDIVRPLWDFPVEVTGKREGKMIRLEDIRKLDVADEA